MTLNNSKGASETQTSCTKNEQESSRKSNEVAHFFELYTKAEMQFHEKYRQHTKIQSLGETGARGAP